MENRQLLDRLIKHPKKVQLYHHLPTNILINFVEHQVGYIGFLNDPSEHVKIAAVQSNWENIRFINNQSETVKQIAFDANHAAFEFIKSPSAKLRKAALDKSPWLIRYIVDPTETEQMTAVYYSKNTIECIKNPTPKIQRLALARTAIYDIDLFVTDSPLKFDKSALEEFKDNILNIIIYHCAIKIECENDEQEFEYYKERIEKVIKALKKAGIEWAEFNAINNFIIGG